MIDASAASNAPQLSHLYRHTSVSCPSPARSLCESPRHRSPHKHLWQDHSLVSVQSRRCCHGVTRPLSHELRPRHRPAGAAAALVTSESAAPPPRRLVSHTGARVTPPALFTWPAWPTSRGGRLGPVPPRQSVRQAVPAHRPPRWYSPPARRPRAARVQPVRPSVW